MSDVRPPASDYSHRYHAGNIGDVWKHTALVAVLDALVAARRPVHVVDTHAGEGVYAFQVTGEYTEGIGRLRKAFPTAVVAVDRYVQRVHELTHGDPRAYPGSPLFIVGAKRDEDVATLCEIDPTTCAALRRHIRGAEIVQESGYDVLARVAVADGAELFVHIDPPFVAKSEWDEAPDAIAALRARIPTARCMLWYPVKSYTRPNTMLARLRKAGVPAVAIELLVTPLDLKRNALAGSGVLLVDPPAGVIPALHAAASAIGPACATHDGRWFTRTTAWIR